MKILVIDVGGSNVKFLATAQEQPRKFPSGDKLTPEQMVAKVREQTADWDYEAISLGLPAPFGKEGLRCEPENLGDGWVGFDFAKAFGKSTKVINDAAMQALGAYEGGRMLFLGLGTGLGSTLIINRVILPLELGRLAYAEATIADYLGKAGLKKHGKERWLRALHEIVPILREAFVADHVVLGGGRVDEVEKLPEGAKRGGNSDALEGGFRLWETEVVHADHAPAPEVWRVVA
jgi:polyphosphate glucokinase